MPIIFFLFFLFLFIYLELSLLVWIGSRIGILGLLLVLLFSSIFGLVMIRTRGWYTLLNVQKQLAKGEIPARSLLQSGLWIVAGILFFIPGFLTDIFAIVLLLPITSLWIESFIARKLHLFRHRFFRKTHRTFQQKGDVFDAEYEKHVDEDKRIK